MCTDINVRAAAAGNFTLAVMATGGVSPAGGMPPWALSPLQDTAFTQALTAKGRFGNFMRPAVQVVVVGATIFGTEHAVRR